MNVWTTILLLLAPALQEEQEPPAHTKIASVTAEPSAAKAGETFHLVFKVQIDPMWHIYSANGRLAPTSWKLDEGMPVEMAGKVEEPKPRHHKDQHVEYDYHEGEVAFRVPVRWTKDAKPGPIELKGLMSGQECDPRLCIMFEMPFAVKATVGEGGVTTPPPADGHTRIVSIQAEPAQVKVGETFHLNFKIQIEPNWHIYSVNSEGNGTAWEFDSGVPIESAGKPEESKTKHKKDEFSEYDYHEGEATFRVPVRLTAAAKPGPLKINGKLIGQECDPKVCVPFEIPISVPVTVIEGGIAAPPSPPPSTSTQSEAGDEDEAQKELQRRGLVGFLALSILGGLVSLVMPCTYPMIPVTLTYFLKQGGESRSKGLLMSLAYAAGIIVSFTALGFILSIVLGADGPRRFAANPWANIAIGTIFMYFAFSLFGLYEIKLPSFLSNAASTSPRSGVPGAFVLGLLFSVVTFTCTIPIAATVLAVAASTGGSFKFVGLVAMLVYSATMAVPFIILGLFPSLLREVPRSGGWLQTVKVTTAFAELGLALAYYAKADLVWDIGFLSRNVMIAVWVAVLAFMSLYLLGLFRLKDDTPPPHLGVARILCAMLFGTLAVYVGFGAKAAGIFDTVLPAYIETATGVGGEKAKDTVFLNLDKALEEARRVNKPVFVEFTGAT